MKPFLTLLVVVLAIAGGFWLIGRNDTTPPDVVYNATTTPTVSQEKYVNATASDISVASPATGSLVPVQFDVTGVAKGWYFEASFPIEVQDMNGKVVAQTPAQAQGDWMTTSPVPFKASITVKDFHGPAMLVLKKDNPSGDPERDASYSMPILVQ